VALFEEHKHPRADDGKFGSGPGSGGGAAQKDAPDPKKEARAKAQAHFDEQAKKVNKVAKAGGHSEAANTFLNKDRHAVSKAERDGSPNETSERTTKFLRDAQAAGADYKGAVYRGTTPAELEQILSGGANRTTWSVSKDPEGSAHFAKKGGVLLVMPKGHGAIPVDGLDGSNTFNEALIPKGSRWKIGSERNVKGVRVVNLEPVDGDGDGKVREAEQKQLSAELSADPAEDDADLSAAFDNPRTPGPGDGGNLELWGK
jgi:hypothetical protein